MKKRFITAGITSILALSMVTTSCIGSFALSNKLLGWNRQVGSKFVNELVFFAFWILPVYEVAGLADILVINSIEFWSGSNPMANSTKTIDGKNGKYMVKSDESGYTVKDMASGEEFRFDYDSTSDSWCVNVDGQSYKFLTFIDENHVALPGVGGVDEIVELSNDGVFAYKENTAKQNLAFN